jgi:hypothetical protein
MVGPSSVRSSALRPPCSISISLRLVRDLRDRVFTAADEAIPVGQIAERLLVSISYVSKVLSRRRRRGRTRFSNEAFAYPQNP